jgi:hypothetical protein
MLKEENPVNNFTLCPEKFVIPYYFGSGMIIPDPDSQRQKSSDPSGSGSTTPDN